MSPEAARNLWAEGDGTTSRHELRALPDAPARPRRRRAPASSWGDLEWTPAREASPGDGEPRGRRDPGEPAGEPPLGERVADPFAVEPLRVAGDNREKQELEAERPGVKSGASQPARRMRWEEEPRGRRTVRITGQPTRARRRPLPAGEQISSRPDRVALWAVMLGLFLVLMAAATARAGWSNATLGERTIGQGDRGSDVRTLQREGRVGPLTTRALADTEAAARRLGMSTTSTIRAGY